MKFKKHLVVFTFILSLATLVACGNDDKGGNRDIPGWDDSKQNVTFYTWGSAEENALLQNVIDSFAEKEENKDINVIIVKAGNDYYGDLELRLTGSQSPDIVLMKPGYIQPFLKSGAIISLQDYIDKSTKINQEEMIWEANDGYRYNPSTKEIGNPEDGIYSLIKDFSPDFVMNYNQTLVTDSVAKVNYPKEGDTKYPSTTVPMTYSQFIDFAGAMQTSDEKTMGTCLDNEAYQQLLEWIQQAGGSLYTNNQTKVVDIKNDPAVRQAFDYYRMLRDQCTNNPVFDTNSSSFSMGRTAAAITKQSTVQIGTGQLKERQAATIFYGRWAYTSYTLDSDKSRNITGFAPPAVPNGLEIKEDTKYAGITAMVGLSISAKSKQKDAAWKFIEYYFTEGLEDMARIGYNIPGNKKVAATTFLNDPSLSARDKEINQFFYDLALNHSFVIEYNRYLSQAVVETNVLAPNLSAYFADSKGKPFNLELWENTLDKIQADLQRQLDRAMR